MIHRESESPLFYERRLWDVRSDLCLGQAYLQELVDVWAETELLLGSMLNHASGNLVPFDERVGQSKLTGFLLQTPPIFNQNVSLTRAFDGEGDAVYALTSWEYADGAKAVMGDDRVIIMPHLEEKYVLTDRRPGQDVEYQSFIAYHNAGQAVQEASLPPLEEAKIADSIVDLELFSIYSLYKINKLLNVLRTDSHIA